MKTYELLQLLCLISVINAQSNEYTCMRDVNIGALLQQSTLIALITSKSKFACLKDCNKNPNCLSCSYSRDASDNCYLYNRVFNSSDFSQANNVNWYSKKSSSLSAAPTTTTIATTTSQPQSNAISSVFSLMFYFRNTTLNSSITSYNGASFDGLNAAEMAILNNTPVYFLTDYWNNAIIKMSDSWQYIAQVNTINAPRIIKWANDHLYVSSFDGFYKMDYNFNIIQSIVDTNAAYTGIYHNASDNTLFVTIWLRNRIDICDADLNVLSNIAFGSYYPIGVSGHGDSLYVSAYSEASSTVIYVVIGRQIISTLTISTSTAMYIYSIVFDDYGYMALNFRDENTVQLYHINGTSTGFTHTFPYLVFHVNFDFNRRMMISTLYALHFFN